LDAVGIRKQGEENVMKIDFEFLSGGERLRGNLFLPDGEAIAALVMTGPLTSVKEQASGTHAQALSRRGFMALAFDHRYFGESGGQPRQFENPRAKIEDIRAAAVALEMSEQARGLPMAAVGVCAGAGYMAAAVAEEARFEAFAGIAGFYKEATPESIAASQSVLDRGRAAARRWRATGVAETIPAVAPDGGDVGMPLREAYEFYGTSRGAVPNYVNGFAVQSFAETVPFDAVGAAAGIKVPTLVVHSESALAPPLARQFVANLGSAAHREVWLRSVGQIDFYDDPALIGQAADAVAAFFRERLT
jgi:fermentation-respiration switch protein FrsA (DUF1100 family)